MGRGRCCTTCAEAFVDFFENILFVGDSTSTPNNSWTNDNGLVGSLNAGVYNWRAVNVSASGVGVVHWAGPGGLAAAAVASQTRIPTRILVTLGKNDVAGSLAEATWKADYLDFLDRFHSAWPSAVIYLSRPWVRTPTTSLNTVAGWIADIQAARSTFVELGPDERAWVENGDDGTTNTTDGIHFSAAGQIAAAAAWYAILPH